MGGLLRADVCLPTESVLENVMSFPSKEKAGLIISPYVCSCFLRYIVCLQLFFVLPQSSSCLIHNLKNERRIQYTSMVNFPRWG